jgi:hypothetical protein
MRRRRNVVLGNEIGSDHDKACRYCRAGSIDGFSWDQAESLPPESRPLLRSFVVTHALRYGVLYHCRHCGQPWHCDDSRSMTRVDRERLPLVEAWNRAPILLSREHVAVLEKIGHTPSAAWQQGTDITTPCAVTTDLGERFERAIVSVQRRPPIERERTYRLGNEIAQLQPSPYAAPLAVRVDQPWEEPHPGAVIRAFTLPDGSVCHLDVTMNFCEAGANDRVVYFVADG